MRLDRETTITLRIKKVYFNKIASGEKVVEYRKCTPFYDNLFQGKRPISHLLLHYQKPPKLVVEVKGVRKIRTPKHLKDSKIEFGRQVYEVRLGRTKQFKTIPRFST